MKEYASEVQNTFCMKTKIEGQRFHQLDSLVYSGWVGGIGNAV